MGRAPLYLSSVPRLEAWQLWVVGEYGPVTWSTKLAVGIGADLNADGEFWSTAYVAYGDLESTATRTFGIEEQTVPMEGSARVENAIAQRANDVLEALAAALEALAKKQG